MEATEDRQTIALEQRFAWRMQTFLDLGCDIPLAEALASSEVDLHEMAALIRSGCPPETAAKILR